jgi:hypothetical protein
MSMQVDGAIAEMIGLGFGNAVRVDGSIFHHCPHLTIGLSAFAALPFDGLMQGLSGAALHGPAPGLQFHSR